MNLLVGNYLKGAYGAADAMKSATDLINWWRMHLVPMTWLQAEMDRPLALLTGCLTRWGSQVAAIIRLLQFKQAMQILLLRKKGDIMDMLDKKAAKDRAELVLSVVEDRWFWTELETLVQNLLPIR